ncbi:S8 family peptidase [Clostridium sp.]|uniref:S8 family peptidase n=1 Tax=Clostridium sp. TaxID=1506 RepID=UPI00283C49A1|nr:S8 family peptidase [Clostridium sp.]MDR3594897.1 S8 family peptidase [Clostridium sp.]
MKGDFRQTRNIFSDPNYYHYVVEYGGNIEEEISKQPGYYVTIINDKYAVVSAARELQLNVEEPIFSTIVYVAPLDLFTLQEISPLSASQADFLQLELPLKLTGRGVTVAIIDTGIDYLNEEFMRENGETRIEYIWDQTIEFGGQNEKSIVPYGSVYTKSNIQEAINDFKNGKSPYEIVPTKDEIGHGTNMAGIIGARGKNPNLKGVVPECDFIIIKLLQYNAIIKRFNIQVPTFDLFSIFPALEFLYRYSLSNNKPLVVYFPLGSNLGSHKGDGILEQFMDSISSNSGIAIVTGSGNQGASGCHSSGTIPQVNASRIIQLFMSPEQKNIVVEIWIDSPNIMSLEIISPSGENTGKIKALIRGVNTYSFLFENTPILINSYFPEEITGDQSFTIRFSNIKEGIWKLRLTGESILDGRFNAWIPAVGISVGGTGFIPSDPYGTIMTPSTSSYTITAAAYNQNNNNVVEYSGMAFLDDYIDKIDVAAGGVNALTVAPNNTTAVVNGTSVAAAILAGACAMLFEWGIVDGNDPNIYSQTIKTYIQRGVIQRSGDIYPNPQWGYGILNVVKIFQNMI